ncbi:MAG TPA: DUF4038 domain-containing protein, partial [Longimicrobiales bacterium]|nr:DUF4038 domain-containing protein [Longimicrobiales bacterium]
VASSGTHLEHADGTPFFWLVDTSWNGPLLSDSADWELYLRDRRDKLFTGIQFVTTHWRTAPTNAEGLVAYTGHDDIRIDPEFFRRLDARIDAINAAGLLAVPVLLWTLGPDDASPGRLPESEAVRLARYLVARYQANHVMFFLPGDGTYTGENAERWKRIGSAVFDIAGHAPVMLHPGGLHWPYDEWREVDWLAVAAYQSGHGDDDNALRWIHSGPPALSWREEPIRPFINVEPPYEGHRAYQSGAPHSAYTVRRAVYWSLLNAPTAGVSYGAHGVWSWEPEPGVPLNHSGSGEARPWFEAIGLPGSTSMRHAAALFQSLDWWRLRPDDSLVVEEERAPAVRTTLTHVVYSRSADGAAVLYVDGELRGTAAVAGDFSNWDEGFGIALGDETSGGRAWLGEYRRVAIYDRAMDEDEIASRNDAGPTAPASGAIVLYEFDEGAGDTVRDSSGSGDPLNLRIESTEAAEWVPGGGLRLTAPVRIAGSAPATKAIDALRASGEVTIEAWITPANTTQAGPARILTISQGTSSRNLTLGQDGEAYEMRLRTTATSVNGLPAVRTDADASRHIAASRTDTGDVAVVYLPVGGWVRIRTERLAPGATARWYDPRTGESTRAETDGEGVFQAPDSAQDWVLVFD